MKQWGALGLGMILMLLLVSLAQGQRGGRGGKQEQSRSVITNQLIKNQQIEIQIKVFNSTHNIYNTTHETIYSSDVEEMIVPVTVEIFEQMENITAQIAFKYKDLYSSNYTQAWRGQANLTKYKKISKMNSEEFFATGEMGSSSAKSQKGNYTLHIAQDFNIMIIYSEMTLPGTETELLKKINFPVTQFEFNGRFQEAKYLPRPDISQMHTPYKYYKPITGLLNQINQTQHLEQTDVEKQNASLKNENSPTKIHFQIKNHTIKMHIYPYDLMKYAVFYQMFDPSQREEAMKVNPLMQYMMDEEALDDMKELLFTNNLYIVALTMIMTLLKTILEVFALKNEFKVWNQIEKNKGLSLKILYTDLLFQMVFFLYLVDNESNLMMTVPMALGISVVLWKIKKTLYIQKSQSFPYFKLKHYDWCRHHQKIDNQGVTYMYYGLIGLFMIYLGYQMATAASVLSIFSYSGMLQKVVFFMGMAGFIRMTPQLYINYKLKSVDHLPWKTLIYRFIETIIDDFYVFLVTTPLLHKIMVFRQDVIFLLYIYQRLIYKTDPNRIGTAAGLVLEKQQVNKVTNEINQRKSQKNQ